MAELKTERHHWWPVCVSKNWAGSDGKTGWLKPDGSVLRLPPGRLGVISNGHHIKMGNDGESSPWDESFERAFDKADRNFPGLVQWLERLERHPMRDVSTLTQRFVTVACEAQMLELMTECAVSLAIRGPMNRAACASLAEQLRGPLRTAERNALIGLNMRNSQKVVADSIGSRGKFVVLYSQTKEFVFGDGFFHNVTNVRMEPHAPKMLVPVTPNISILVCRPSSYLVNPQLTTLVLTDNEVDLCNDAVQVYSRDAIYFREQAPEPNESFRSGHHECYAAWDNPIDSLIGSIPGVPPRKAPDLRLAFPAVPEFRR
jgi:hypothetical protein